MLIADKLFSVSYRQQYPCTGGLGVHTLDQDAITLNTNCMRLEQYLTNNTPAVILFTYRNHAEIGLDVRDLLPALPWYS